MKHHAEPLPKSLTHSNLDRGIITDEERNPEADKPVINIKDFGHIAAYMESKSLVMPETGGVNEEGYRMEVD